MCSPETDLNVREMSTVDDFISIFTSRSTMKVDDNANYEDARALILDNVTWMNYFLNKLKSSIHS